MNRRVPAVSCIMGNQGKCTKEAELLDIRFSLYFRLNFTFGDEAYIVDRETTFLGLPVF